MKKTCVISLSIALTLLLSSCGGTPSASGAPLDSTSGGSASVEDVKPTPEKVTMDETAFQDLLSQLPLVVTSTRYVVQDAQYKALYPDMLQATLVNNTSADIKDAVIAFAAWDENNLPVKLKGNVDFSDGSYVKKVNYNDINLAGGGSFGENSGFSVSEDCNVSSFVAVVVSFETFDGEKWTNPYYKDWCSMYEGVKYTSELGVEVTITDAGFKGQEGEKPSAPAEKENLNQADLQAEIDGQEVRITQTKYVVQNAQYKALYPDMLQAIIQNDSTSDIKNAVIAFVAWDKNNLPVKIKGSYDFADGVYVNQVNYSDINLVPGESFGSSSGFEVDEACGIESVKAIVVSYETFEGENWSNPYFSDWCKLYEGQKMS